MSNQEMKDHETGSAILDRDHRILLSFLQKLVSSSESPADINYITAQFRAYLDSHFENEEELMERCQYPERHAHRMEHDQMRRHAERLSQLEGSAQSDAIRTLSLLIQSWIQVHIDRTDREFADYLCQHHIAPSCTGASGLFD